METNGISNGPRAQNQITPNAIRVVTARKIMNVDFCIVRETIKKAATMPL